MTLSTQLLWFVAAIDIVAGYIVGLSWPQPATPVPHILAAFLLLVAVAFNALVFYLRRGRP